MSGFQSFTNQLQAPGVAGDFASTNPRASVLSSQNYGQTGFVAGPNGAVVGFFGWLDSTGRLVSNSGNGLPNGIIGRGGMPALITTYLTAFGMTIPAGFAVPLYDAGDFWVVNNGTTIATRGMKAYANNSTGAITFAATGSPTTGATGTSSTIAASTGSSAASTITDNVLTTGPAVTGAFVVGGTLSGTGVASGTIIVAQLSGTAGSVGTYQVSPRDQTVASTTISETYGTMTIGGTVTGTFAVGQTVSGSGVTTGTVITALGTGTGGAGTYIVSPTQTVGSPVSISTTTNTEANWYCGTPAGQPGDLVKISSRVGA